ncbi:MAG: precorrin-2 dehydrogenase/sirohydrochlorin ferrochelatase family protein [Bacillota bacterium]
MAIYPVCLNLAGRECLVVGGGPVAERKVKSLLEGGARVRVVSYDLTPALQNLANGGLINYRQGGYAPDDLRGIFLVVSASDDAETNCRVARESSELGLLCNVVDDPSRSSFFTPAVVRQGDLSISISTGGQCPMLARRIREKLEGEFGPEYARFLELMGQLRPLVKERYPDPEQRYRLFQQLVDSDLLQLLSEGNDSLVKERIQACLSW